MKWERLGKRILWVYFSAAVKFWYVVVCEGSVFSAFQKDALDIFLTHCIHIPNKGLHNGSAKEVISNINCQYKYSDDEGSIPSQGFLHRVRKRERKWQ